VAFLLLGCAGSLPEPGYSPQPDGAFEVVQSAPPPARIELVPGRPKNADAVWIDGEWRLSDSRWVWQNGRWVEPPRGATYSKWATKKRADGALLFAPGAFRDRKGAPLATPQPLSVGQTTDDGAGDE
jgi:WXXGXW repeat (2 copies)